MTQFYRYRSTNGATSTFSVDLVDAVRLGSVDGFVDKAEHCQVGISNIVIDDPNGTVGNGSDAILGHQRFEVDETDMASGNRRLFTAYIASRTYGRLENPKAPNVGVARQIEAELVDLNALLSFRVIPQSDTTAKRPAETVAARLTWILASTYLTGLVADNGLVVSGAAFGMDKADYRGQRPVNVINDCELAAGWFAFVYPDETKTVIASLFFANANTSTAYTSTLRISNVLADLDTVTAAQFTTGTTFAASDDAKLRRDPSELGSGVYLPYTKGAVYRTRAATAAIYGYRDLVAPNANVKTASKANDIADRFLWEHSTEDDRITVTVELPTNKVNLIRAGHRIQVKFSHLPGYESFTWCRVLQRSVGQTKETDDRYQVQLELSPQEAAPVATGIVQSVFFRGAGGGATPTLPNPVTVGNKLIAIISDRNDPDPAAPQTADPALPRFGLTAWTRFNGVQLTKASATSYGISAYYKTADSTSQSGFIAGANAVVAIFELTSGANPAAATIQYVNLGNAGPTHDIAASTTIAAGQVGIAAWNLANPSGWSWDYSNSYAWQSPDPPANINAGWTLGISKWSYDHYSLSAYIPAEPWTVIGYTTTAGVIVPRVTPGGATHNWAGFTLVIP